MISRALHPWLQQPLLRMTRSRRAHPHRRARRCCATVAATVAAVATLAVAVDAGCNAAEASVSEAGEHAEAARSWQNENTAGGDMMIIDGWVVILQTSEKTSMLIDLRHIYIYIWDDVSC